MQSKRSGPKAILNPKSSLLSRQKLQRRRAVLDSAKLLIKAHGYELTTMEGMASHAGLSTQTVYNYFGTKLDVLMELYVEDRDIAEAKIRGLRFERGGDPVEFLMEILRADLHREVEVVNNALWRQVAAAEATSCEGKHYQTFQSMNLRYHDAIRGVFGTLIASGTFKADLDLEAATMLFLHVSEGLYRKIIATPDATFSRFSREARRQLRVLVSAFLPESSRIGR